MKQAYCLSEFYMLSLWRKISEPAILNETYGKKFLDQ